MSTHKQAQGGCKPQAIYTLLSIGNTWVALFHCDAITTLHEQWTTCTSKAQAEALAERIVTQYNLGA